MFVWNRIILLPMFFFSKSLYPHPPLVTYIYTHLSLYHPASSEVAYVIPPIQPIHPTQYICRDLPHPTHCFNNVYNQLYTSLSVPLPLASAYNLYKFVPLFETISIRLNVKWNQDEWRLPYLRENSRSASTKREIILEEGNQNENQKPAPWNRNPASFNCLIIN